MTMVDDRPSEAGRRRPTIPNILLVEDNPLDARSTIRAVRKLELAESVEVVTDGQAALDHLRQTSAGPDAVGLVLLDLNLPGKDGHDVLAEMRADPDLQVVPVVVLTSSIEPTDIDTAYRRGANAYVSKPTELDGWLRTIDSIREFWLRLAILPGH